MTDTDQVSPGDSLQRVASGADLLVDLVSSSDARLEGNIRKKKQAVNSLVPDWSWIFTIDVVPQHAPYAPF